MAKIEEPKVTPERLMQFGFAYAPPLIIGAATANKVFDTLASGAKNVEEVSQKNGASLRGLRAIARVHSPRLRGMCRPGYTRYVRGPWSR